MTDTGVGNVARDLAGAPDIDTYLAAEAAAGTGDRFAALETAAAAVLGCAFAGRAPVYARAKKPPVFTSAVPVSAIVALETAFDIGTQQHRGAWWLPEQLSVKWGTVNVPAYYRDYPAWAMTRAGDDSGKFPTEQLAVFACWALLGPLADDLLEPLTLRGPSTGAFEPDTAAARWAAIADRYRDLGLDSAPVMTALEAMTPGHGWSRLEPPAQVEAKQRLLDALAPAVDAGTVRRWRAGQVRELAGRYVARSKRGPAESRAVLVKAVQPTLAAWFGGDWLSLLNYLGEKPAEGEVIQTALPAPRLYVEGSAKVQQVAREKNLPPEQVAAMLASYLGSDAVQSPVQQRVRVIRAWWDALDAAQAAQRPGTEALDPAVDPQRPVPGTPEQPWPDLPSPSWLTAQLSADIQRLWAGALVPTKPDRLVSALSPMASLRQAAGPALTFWIEVAASCWYICEGPYSRTDLPGLRSYYRRYTLPMAAAGTPVNEALFAELEAAEARLGPPEPMLDPGRPIDASNGISIVVSVGSGTRRAGYEILRDIVTRHRRAWASQHLDGALRAAWEGSLRDLSDKINRALAARGKAPTTRQRATMAAPSANAWFGGDFTATLAAVGETSATTQPDARMLPADRQSYCRRVWRGIGGVPAHDQASEQYRAAHQLLWLASGAPKIVRLQELLDRPPTAKEAGFNRYESWPEGLSFDRLAQASAAALTETERVALTETERVALAEPPAARAGENLAPSAPAAPAFDATTSQRATAAEAPARRTREPSRSASTVPAPGTPAAPASGATQGAPAAWYPDTRQRGMLRWWDSTTWSALTAPAPGAGAGWFTDPQRADQLRWFDGTAWTQHTHPAAPAGVDHRAPWEAPALPAGLTEADFAAARQVAAELTGTVTCGSHLLGPARGAWARYQHAYGTNYPHNQARLRALINRAPLARTPEGWAVYPAVLVPDPSPSDTGTVPIGASSEVGYIGSVWSSVSASWAQRVRDGLAQHRYFVTRAAVATVDGELAARIWLPSLDLPPWQR